MTGPPDDAPPPDSPGWGPEPQHPPHGYPPHGQPGPYGVPYPPGPYPAGPYPAGTAPPAPTAGAGPVRAGPAILGFLIGVFMSAGGLVLTTLSVWQALDARAGEYTNNAGKASLIASALWAVVAAALLAFPKTRRAGAGLLAGLAIGVILLSGVCAAIGAAQ